MNNMKCLFFKEGKCNSDYGSRMECDGIHPPLKCPYPSGKPVDTNDRRRNGRI